MEYGRGALLKDGWGIAARLQLTLTYTGLLCPIAVEIALSTSSCASSKDCITTFFTHAHHEMNPR